MNIFIASLLQSDAWQGQMAVVFGSNTASLKRAISISFPEATASSAASDDDKRARIVRGLLRQLFATHAAQDLPGKCNCYILLACQPSAKLERKPVCFEPKHRFELQAATRRCDCTNISIELADAELLDHSTKENALSSIPLCSGSTASPDIAPAKPAPLWFCSKAIPLCPALPLEEADLDWL